MIKTVYGRLDHFRKEMTPHLSRNDIEKKGNELGVIIPERMIEFYEHFGNDKKILTSDYELERMDDWCVDESALCFGYVNQGSERLGVKLSSLDMKVPSVSFKPKNEDKWFNEEGSSTVFFYRVACWQVLMAMNAVACVDMSEKQFQTLVEKDFSYISDEKLLLRSPVLAIVMDDILGCYRVRDGLLYLGTNKDEVVLEEIEEKFNLDLDWL